MKKKRSKAKRIILGVFISLILLVALSAVAFGAYLEKIADEEFDLSLFKLESTNSATKFYYMENGEWVEWADARIYGSKNYEFIPIERIPENMINAFVAIEDKRFFKHSGVDFLRSAEAAVNYIFGKDKKFGASSITQQLVKNITGNDEVSISRKIKEMAFALELEENLEKDEILELYLNVISFSDSCYGVQSASRRYFSKDASELSLLECACIAAITNSPSYYNPIKNPENNKYRRDLILSEMLEQGMITADEFEESYGKDVELSPDNTLVDEQINSWYIEMALDDVIADLEASGYSRAAATRTVFGGGLEIYLCIEPDIQDIMENYYENEANFISGEGAQSSMIIISPENGDVLGVVGAIGEKTGNRVQNCATQTKRPPGSTIKPLSVYAPALENGKITYASVYDDTPIKFTPLGSGSYSMWPKNANGVYHGLSTMSYAVANSTNTVALKVLSDVGLSHSFYFLRDTLGMTELVETGRGITDMDYAALALGQLNYGVSLRAITAAYSIFADNGSYHSPRSYVTVKNSRGEIVLEKGEVSRRAISDGNSEIMTKLLEEVVWGGTADDLTVKERVAVACKTGTSQDNKDRWCIGYTPSLICGVWYGYEYPREIPRAEKDHFLCAFDGVLEKIYESGVRSLREDREFTYDAGLSEVVYCMDSGLLPCEACRNDARGSRLKLGYFVSGTEPTEECKTHITVEYDAVCGGIATVDTPKEHIREIGMIQVSRAFPVQLVISDAQYVYKRLDDGILPSFAPDEAFFSSMQTEGVYFGMSNSKKQFNRISTGHIIYSDIVFRRKILR